MPSPLLSLSPSEYSGTSKSSQLRPAGRFWVASWGVSTTQGVEMPGSSDQQVLIFMGLPAAIPVLLGIRRRREGIRYRLRKLIIVEGIYLGLAYLMLQNGQPPLQSILAGLVAAFVVTSFIRPRSRYIPASVKRKPRAEFELKTGTKFTSMDEEYDHKDPFT